MDVMVTLVVKIASEVLVVVVAALAAGAVVVVAAVDNSIETVAKVATAVAVVTIDMVITIDVAKTGHITVNETLNQQPRFMVSKFVMVE